MSPDWSTAEITLCDDGSVGTSTVVVPESAWVDTL